jgi:hypothetical protein
MSPLKCQFPFAAIHLLESAPQESFTSAYEDLSHLPAYLSGRFSPLSPVTAPPSPPRPRKPRRTCRRTITSFSPCAPLGRGGQLRDFLILAPILFT